MAVWQVVRATCFDSPKWQDSQPVRMKIHASTSWKGSTRKILFLRQFFLRAAKLTNPSLTCHPALEIEKSRTERERRDQNTTSSVSPPQSRFHWLLSFIRCARDCVPPELNVSSHSIPWPDNHSSRRAKEKTNTFCICELFTPLQMTIPSRLHKVLLPLRVTVGSIVKTQQCFSRIWEVLCAKATENDSVCEFLFSSKYKEQIVI